MLNELYRILAFLDFPLLLVSGRKQDLLTLGSGNCLKFVPSRPYSHFVSLWPTFLFLLFTVDSGFFSSCANLLVWQELARRRLFFCLLSSLGAEDLANWELNGGKSQAGKFVHEMDFFVFLRICRKQI